MSQRPQQPGSLEHIVAQRYIHELNSSGYQPICLHEDEMLTSAMDTLAKLNQATQLFKFGGHKALGT